MLGNYLRITLRNLSRHRGFTFINVTGLSVGMAACLLIFLYVRDELSYDRYHRNRDRLYRLAVKVDGASYENGLAKVADLWGPGAKAELPEVVEETRFVIVGKTLIQRGERRQYESAGMFADSATFRMFSWPLINGDPQTALEGPDKAVLTKSFTRRWFGEENPMGQTLLMDNDRIVTVSGVMEDVPANSHFTFDFLVSLESYHHENRGDWVKWNQFYTYLLLAPSARPDVVAAKLDQVLRRHLKPESAPSYHTLLQPLTSIHLHSNLHREIAPNSDVGYVYTFSTIALFILLIACTNFVSLSTARASHRAQEVGVRKVSGADRSMLVRQFLGESILLCSASMILAWVLSIAFLSLFNELSAKSFQADDLLGLPLVAGLLITAGFVGAAAGVYPAFILSSFRPVKVLKGDTGPTGSGMLRKGLVVFQFAISACMIIATGVVYGQLNYIQHRDLGFDKEQIVVIPTNDRSTASHYQTIKAQLRNVPGVVDVSFSANRPGGSDWGIPVEFEGVPDEEQPTPRMLCVDEDFIDTYGMQIVDGRGFSRAFPSDTSAYILNETAAKALGWTVAGSGRIGMPVVGRDFGEVIGSVRDFNFRSMHEKIAPLILLFEPGWLNTFSVRISPGSVSETLAGIKSTMASHEPEYPFTYRFFDEQFDSLHAAEVRIGNVLGYFAGLAIFIACLGLLGLASFSAERRTKEIGVRKVLGASVTRILVLLTTDVAVLVLLGVAVASPVAYLVMSDWLSSFAYTAGMGWAVFLYAAVTVLTLAVAATCLESIRAALVDPVACLRYE